MVEWTALEMRRTLTGTLGSNPSLSAESKKGVRRPPFLVCLISWRAGTWSEPALLLVPADALPDTLFERPAGRIAEVADGWFRLALPVALRQDVVLVVVQGIHLSGEAAYPAAYPAHGA